MKLLINYTHNLFEVISFLVTLLNYRYLKGSFMKWVLPFLAFISISGLVMKYTEWRYLTNYLTIIVESIFYGYIFYVLNPDSFVKKVIIFFVPVLILWFLVSCFFLDTNHVSMFYFSIGDIISGFFISTIALFYLYNEFKNENMDLITEPGFWIAAGVSLFYSGESITYALYNIIIKYDLRLFGVRMYNMVPRILCVILYSFISVSIILWKKKKIKYLMEDI